LITEKSVLLNPGPITTFRPRFPKRFREGSEKALSNEDAVEIDQILEEIPLPDGLNDPKTTSPSENTEPSHPQTTQIIQNQSV
jgi:hypothetical protein